MTSKKKDFEAVEKIVADQLFQMMESCQARGCDDIKEISYVTVFAALNAVKDNVGVGAAINIICDWLTENDIDEVSIVHRHN